LSVPPSHSVDHAAWEREAAEQTAQYNRSLHRIARSLSHDRLPARLACPKRMHVAAHSRLYQIVDVAKLDDACKYAGSVSDDGYRRLPFLSAVRTERDMGKVAESRRKLVERAWSQGGSGEIVWAPRRRREASLTAVTLQSRPGRGAQVGCIFDRVEDSSRLITVKVFLQASASRSVASCEMLSEFVDHLRDPAL
jgi:hypothetical protein